MALENYIPWAIESINVLCMTAIADAAGVTSEMMRFQSFRTTLRAVTVMANYSGWRSTEQLASRRRACRFSFNLRHVLENHSVMNYHTNPPSLSTGIALVLPVYHRLDAALDEADLQIHTANDFQWAMTIEGIRQEFATLAEHWHDYMMRQQQIYRSEYALASSKLSIAEEQLEALRIIRMCSRTERARIQVNSLVAQIAAVTRSSRCLDTAFAVLLLAYPGADRV